MIKGENKKITKKRPAAAVIPALRVYLKVAAVKKPIADFIENEVNNQLSDQLVGV